MSPRAASWATTSLPIPRLAPVTTSTRGASAAVMLTPFARRNDPRPIR